MTPPPKGAILLSEPTIPAAVSGDKFAPPKGATVIEAPNIQIAPGLNVAASRVSLGTPAIDVRDVAVAHADVDDSEKAWLKENKDRLTPQEFDHSLNVFTGKEASFLTHGQYYYDDKGIPQQVKFGTIAPPYAMINSVWGSQHASEDDSIVTTFAKHAFNGFVGIAKVVPTLWNLEADLLGLKEDHFLRLAPDMLKRELEALDFKTSTASNQPFASIGEKPKLEGPAYSKYNTQIPNNMTGEYKAWLESNSLGDVDSNGNGIDYDYKGAFLAGLNRDAKSGQHFPDTFKKPNHPTFSVESKYNGIDGYLGGTWSGDKFIPPTSAAEDIAGKNPYQGLADNWSDIKFTPTAQNIAGALGGAVGMILQMVATGGGGLTKVLKETAEQLAVREGISLAEATAIKTAEAASAKLAERGVSLSQRVAPFAKKTGINTLYMLNSSYESATEAGLTGRERFAVSMMSAVGQGIIMTKMFPEIPVSAMDRGVQKEISNAAVNAFVKEGGAITPESLKAAFKNTMIATVEKAPAAVSKIPPRVKQVFKTGAAMPLNTAWDNGVMSLDAKLTGRTDDNEYFSPKAFTEYFNSFVSGIALGVVGAPLHKTPQERTENQSKMAYAYIREGREAELLHNIKGLADNGQITPEQHADAVARVNGYKRYAAETKNIKLSDEEREQVFNNIFNGEKMRSEMDAIEKNETITPTFKEAQKKALHHQITETEKAIADIITKPVETAKAATKTGEEFPGTGKPEEQPATTGAETPKMRRERIVKPVIEANPEFTYQKHKATAGMVPKTEKLGGAYVISKERGRGEPEMKRWEARKKLKVGDVLTVRRFLPSGAEKFKVQERVNQQGEYRHLLNAFDAEGNQVGSISYGAANDRMINKLMDEGQDVRVVITDKKVNSKEGTKDELEYQIISKPREGQAKDIVRERHLTPATEAVVTPRQLHETITATGRAKPRELLNEPVKPKAEGEIPFEKPPVEEPVIEKESVETPVSKESLPTEKPEPVAKEKPKKQKASTEDQKRKKELIEVEPKTFEQAVLQYLASGQKISYEHLVRNVGKGVAKSYFMFSKKGGQQTDLLNEIFDLEKLGIKDTQQAENELFSLLTSHIGKASMLARLIEIAEEQKSAEERDTFEALKGIAPEETAAIDKEIDSIIEADAQNIHVNDALVHLIDTVNPSMKGLDSIDAILDVVEKNKDLFDGFPYEKSDYEEIIKTLNDEKGIAESRYGEDIKAAVNRYSQEISKRINGESGTEKDAGEEIKFQSASAEALASATPEIQQKISEHLAGLFPKIKVFHDTELFQSFLDRNFPGAKLDLSKLGAAIGDAIYINPDRAVQSTQIHEHAHIYWDSLPESDALKAKITKLFPNEEAAITAIGQLGTQAAKIKLSGNSRLKFMQYAKEFWAKVKNAFGVANEKDLAELFASKMWKGAEVAAENKPGPLKYMERKLTDIQQRSVSQLQQIADHFLYDPLAHTYTLAADGETQFKPVNDVLKADPKFAYKGNAGDIAGQRGNQLHSLAEALTKGEDFDVALEKSKLKMTDQAKEQFKSQVNKVIETLRGKGEILPETIFANSYYKTAGRPDMAIVGADGVLHIYDFKTSTGTTKEGGFYEKATETSAAKKEKHGVQLAMYSELAKHGDAAFRVDPQIIGESGVIPIRLTIGQEGEITNIEVEPTVNVPYEQYRTKAKELLQKNRSAEIKSDAKQIKGAKVMSREKYFKKKGFDEDAMNEKIDSLEEGDPQLEVFREALDDHHAEYEKYVEDLQSIKEYVDADFNSFSDQQLADAHDTIVKYDNLLFNAKMRPMLGEINSIIQRRLQGEKGSPELDISSPYLQSAYDISEKQPALQKLSSEVNDAKQSAESSLADIEREAKKVFLDVIREKEKSLSTLGKLTKSFAKSDLSKYFDNLFAKKADEDGPAILKDWKDETNDLSKSERAALKFMDEKMSPYKKQQILSERGHWDGFYAEVSPNYWEMYHKYGFLKALGAKFRDEQPEEINDVMVNVTIDGKTESMRYIDAENAIADYSKRGAKEKVAASLKLTKAHLDAKKAMEKIPIEERGGSSRYTLNKSGEMVSKFYWKRSEGADTSYDVYRSFMSYMTDMIHTEKMNEIMPEIVATRKFYQLSKTQPNVNKFMDLWIDGDIFGKEFVGDFGRKVDAGAKFLSGWTYINVMSFNTKVGLFNWTTGKMNQFRAEGAAKLWAGEKRYFANFRKAQGALKHYTITDDITKGPAKYSFKNIFTAAANLPSSSGENSIRGAAFLSHLTEAEYKSVIDNFDKDGNIIDPSKGLSPQRVTQLKKMVSDIQGKYSYAEKRMYKHYSLMRSLMMFKGWMPDFIKERFGGEYTDRYLVTHKGAYLSIPYIFRDAKMMFMDRRNWKESKDVDVINNRKNMREAMMYASAIGIYAMVHGDSDEEKRNGKLIQTLAWDLAGLMDLSRTKSTIGKPFPMLGTVSNFIDAVTSLTEFYARDGKYGKKGDWMFPGKLLNVLPYNRAVGWAAQEIANPDYTGN